MYWRTEHTGEEFGEMASVNVMKVTRANVNGLSVHLDNEKREEKEHSNKHINKELTKENYFIGCKDWNECKRKMDARTQEVDAASPPKRKVKDRIVAAMMEIPVPKAITDQGQADEFLQASFEQLQALYGVENVHGMAVHKDEVHEYRDKDGTKKTSLIHAHALVSAYATWEGKETIRGENGKPLRDENNKIRKRTVEVSGINGKNFVTRPMLNKLQNSFNEMCKEKFGMEYQTHGEVWNKTVEELKRESEYAANVVERMNEYEREYAAEVEDKFKHLEWENKFLAERVDERQKQLDTTKANLSIAKEDIRQAEERIKTLQNENKELETVKTTLETKRAELEEDLALKKQYEQMANEQNLEMDKELERKIIEHDEKKLAIESMKNKIEHLEKLQEFANQIEQNPMPKMTKQLVGSGIVVQDTQENIERAYAALEVVQTLDARATELVAGQQKLKKDAEEHAKEHEQKLYTAKKAAKMAVIEEHAKELNEIKREKEELQRKLKNAKYGEKQMKKYMEQTGQTHQFEVWKEKQASLLIDESLRNMREIAGMDRDDDYGFER
jgi:hypothetical protein